jgi:hypothetical protein
VNTNNSRYQAGKIQIDTAEDLRIDFDCGDDTPIQDGTGNSVISTRDIYGNISFSFGPRQ